MKIKPNYERIIDEFALIESKIMIFIIHTLFPDDSFSEFDTTQIHKSPNSIAYAIVFRSKGIDYKGFLKKIIRKNKEVVSKECTQNKTFEEIEEILNRDLYKKGNQAGNYYFLVLLKFFSENVFQSEMIDKLKVKCKELIEKKIQLRKELDKEKREEDVILYEELKGTRTEAFFNGLMFEYSHTKGCFEHFKPELIEDKFLCKYDEKNKLFNNVKRGILFYLFSEFKYIIESNEYVRKMSDIIASRLKEVDKEKEKVIKIRKGYFADKERNIKLKTANKSLKKENKRLNDRVLKKIDKSSQIELENRVHTLQKDNNYHLSRIERLEEQIAILEEEKKLNEELAENIVIEEKPEKKVTAKPEYLNIVVMGGRWTSNNRKDVQNYLINNDIEFIEADKTLRSFDKISNADIIFFDTTFNSHSYYYKAKKCNAVFYHINNSNLTEFEKIFEEN